VRNVDHRRSGVRMRTVVVTGASSGVGLAAAQQFARRGDRVVVVGRSPDRLAAAVELVRAAGDGREPGSFRADFERLDDVRDLAAHLLATYPTIDVLANNAGGMAETYALTVDGHESSIQSNHLAPFLLTNLLRERLRGGRVVNTASDAHKMGQAGTDFVGDPQSFSRWRAYGTGKAANILFAREAARRWPDVLSTSFHPGVVRSNFGSGAVTKFFYRYMPFLTTPQKAGELLVWLATAPAEQLTQGGYYVGRALRRPGGPAADDAEAARLWDASLNAVGLGSRRSKDRTDFDS
jgi:NAD(P)-dependent dehydrogenase (short-subunit alcohol dehydrogenase family)